ncbi:AAA family ATPase [Xanthobacter sp. DSM 24535]|uniref:AAA family ATPase n=1 Tax=Roseixanthobacter psychrophilus TaxID=3119917 RepID=UPI00372761B9
MNDAIEKPANPLDHVREEVRLIMTTEGLTQVEIAKEAGIAYGTFTPWMGGTYKGDNSGIAAKVSRWLETRRERERTAMVLPTAPGFVRTPTASAMLDLFAFAQSAPDFVVAVGGAGIGKTTAIEEYQKRSSNVFVVTAEPCLSSPNNLLSAVADAVGVVERSTNRVSRAVVARLKNAAALIIIDEAQHLESKALDQLRTVHDLAKCGIAIAGNESVFGRLQGGEARGAQFAQLHSRVGMRIVQPKARAKDICEILAAWGIDGAAPAGQLLKEIGRKPGALRNLTKTLRLAGMFASSSGEGLGPNHIRQAWGQLSSSQLETA